MRLRSPLARTSAFVALVVALTSVLAACGSSHKNSKQSSTTTRPKVLEVKTSVLKIGKVDVESAGPPNVQIDTATGRAVLKTAQAYIDDALFAPLKTGAVPAAYGALFDTGVRVAATTTDERALTNIDVGKIGAFTTSASPVTLSAFAGTLGELVYVATDFGLAVHTRINGQIATFNHDVELTFAQQGNKTWVITAYRVHSVRKIAGATTTTAATGGTKP